MNWLRRVWQDLRHGENIDLYITVVVSIVLAALNVINIVPPDWIAPLTLAVLALLSITILGNRYRTERILARMAPDSSLLMEHLPQDELDHSIAQSRTLLLIGVSLQRTLHMHYAALQRKLSGGDTVRVLIINPDSPACEMAATREYQPKTRDEQCTEISRSVRICRQLGQETSGRLEVRTTASLLSHGAYVADLDLPRGAIYLWLYRFRTETPNQPKMVLRPEDGHWYALFKEDISRLWQSATPWQNSQDAEGS